MGDNYVLALLSLAAAVVIYLHWRRWDRERRQQRLRQLKDSAARRDAESPFERTGVS